MIVPETRTPKSLVAWAWIVRLLCLVGVALLLATPLAMAFDTVPVSIGTGDGALTLRIETGAQRRRAVIVSLLPVLAGLYALGCLWRLFGRYARGEVFSATSVRWFARFAYGLLAYWFVHVANRALMSVALSWDNPSGQRVLLVGIGSDDYVLLLFGAVLAAVAKVMQQAARMAEDNAAIV